MPSGFFPPEYVPNKKKSSEQNIFDQQKNIYLFIIIIIPGFFSSLYFWIHMYVSVSKSMLITRLDT